MQISGELKIDKVIIAKPKDVGRLYNKSKFGKPLKDNKLELNLIESVFLLDEGKIKIKKDNKYVCFKELTIIASKKISNFEIKYLVFKDLRKRGYAIQLNKDKNISLNQIKKKNKFFVGVYSEKDCFDLKAIKNKIQTFTKEKNSFWLAIVDEEGDITYYNVAIIDIKGINKEHNYSKIDCILFDNRAVSFDKKAKLLFDKEFFGKPFGEGLQLSLVEILYLNEKEIIQPYTVSGEKISNNKLNSILTKIQPNIKNKLIVFNDLKKRGLLVKTGFKFGSHFRAYSKSPDETHAEFLIHVVEADFKSNWAEISRAVRLAHSVNKEIVFSRVNKNKIDYIKFGRLRP